MYLMYQFDCRSEYIYSKLVHDILIYHNLKRYYIKYPLRAVIYRHALSSNPDFNLSRHYNVIDFAINSHTGSHTG